MNSSPSGVEGQLGTPRHAHLVGIGGVGMSGVARLLQEAGWTVGGSEEGLYPPTSTVLQCLGVPVSMPYSANNIPRDASLIILGKHARLQPGNPEVDAALASGVRVASYPEILAELMADSRRLVVAGTHGKSTSTALVASMLESAGHAPGYLVGAVLDGRPSARLGEGRVFVVEGDEYPSSNLDPTPKFLHYHPDAVLLTAAALDHVDVFATHAEYLAAFQRLIATVPADGLLVFCAEDQYAASLASKAGCRTVSYGVDRGDYSASRASWEHGTALQLKASGKPVVHLTSTLFGRHNVQNIVGASAFLLEQGLARPADLQAATEHFLAPQRRLVQHGPQLFEDIASSPTKMAASVSALRDRFAGRRIVVIFEPYSRTWRHPLVLSQLGTAFRQAGLVLVMHPRLLGNAAGVVQSPVNAVKDALDHAGIPALVVAGHDGLEQVVRKETLPTDVILLATSGDALPFLAPIRAAIETAGAVA